MKRVALLTVVVMGLVSWPGLALGASRQYNGPTASGANAGVEFGARLVHGKPVSVRRFSWFNVPAPCNGSGSTASSDMLGITMRVTSKRTFHATATLSGGGPKVTVVGKFSRNFKKVTGTIRVNGSFPGCGVADSGTIRWTALPVGH